MHLIGIDEVEAGNTKSSGSDLFDGRAAGVAVFIGRETFHFFAAFTGVGFAAKTVHGNCKGLVGLFGDGAVGHRTGLEAFDDFADGLDFLDGDGFCRIDFEVHQSTEGKEILGLVVDDFRVFLEDGVITEAGRLLEFVNGDGIEKVLLTVGTPLVNTAGIEGGVAFVIAGRKGLLVAGQGLLRDGAESDALDAGGSLGEVFVDEWLVEADGFKDLSATVGRDG